ncbi:HNH endonuclease [Dactylosporangium darangshiense]|uniref:HNH endonuclease n=1 Tax=Dactylosporangium darangshiense TaxID=579108 RepID=UPI003625C6A0
MAPRWTRVRRSSATTAAARPAGVQGRRARRLPAPLRDHWCEDPAGAAGGTHPAAAEGGEHRLDNGLLLRSDVHIMFDRGYLSVDPKHRLLVSPRLRDDFGNGEEFYSRSGMQIVLPERKADRPHREFLAWHVDTVFKTA